MLQETEMREFFQKVVDTVAGLSTQAAKVEGLEQRINELADRLRAVEEENSNLRNQLTTAHGLINETQDKLNATRRDYESEMAVSHGLRETIVSRDSRVTELSSNLESEQQGHAVTIRERDEARGEVGDLKALVQSLRDNLARETTERSDWQAKYEESQRVVTDQAAKLDRVYRILNPSQDLHVVAS